MGTDRLMPVLLLLAKLDTLDEFKPADGHACENSASGSISSSDRMSPRGFVTHASSSMTATWTESLCWAIVELASLRLVVSIRTAGARSGNGHPKARS
jgi:hypothetical protein